MTDLMSDVQTCVQTKTPVIIWGPPGIGKTAKVQQLGARLRLPVETVLASVREPADFAGLPVVTPKGVELSAPTWARRLVEHGEGILFLDEISTAAPAVQAALLRVILDRVVGDLPLPEGVAVVAAANPPEMAAGGWDLSPPLANRFVHLHMEPSVSEWSQWAAGRSQAHALVAGFLSVRPHLLLVYPKTDHAAGTAWPSPRSWDMAARLYAVNPALSLLSGAIGTGVGLEFLAWVKGLDLPDPEELLAAPHTYRCPARADQIYAVLGSCMSAVVAQPSVARVKAIWELFSCTCADGHKDVAMVCMTPIARIYEQHPAIKQHAQPTAEQMATLVSIFKAVGKI